jgi:integrase
MKLTNTAVKAALKKPGRYSDGGGLFFRVTRPGAAHWAYRYRVDGKEREMSLGPYPEVSIAAARERHAELRKRVMIDKEDPARQAQDGRVTTFGEAADAYLAAHERSWKNDKHRDQWRMTLSSYCTTIRGVAVDAIDTAAVLRVLKPLWTRAPETASRLRGRIETILDSARAHGHIDDNRANPARWRGHLDKLLPKRHARTKRHFAAMPYRDIPAFAAKLRQAPGVAPLALMLAILTAARTNEALGAIWGEIDFDAKVWTVPAERMKAGVEHRVPLSDAVVEILRDQMKAQRRYVFPGKGTKAPLSNMALAMLMRRLGAGEYTVHGFRSAFRSWCADTGVVREVAEAALAHVVGGVEGAYQRSTMVERRRKVMADWAAFLAGEGEGAKVVPFRR